MLIKRPRFIGRRASVISAQTRWDTRTRPHTEKTAAIRVAIARSLIGQEVGVCRIGTKRHIMTEDRIPGITASETIRIVAVDQKTGAIAAAPVL